MITPIWFILAIYAMWQSQINESVEIENLVIMARRASLTLVRTSLINT